MILDRLLGKSHKLYTYNDEHMWTGLGGGPTSAGVSVNEDSALNYSAVYRAVALISGSSSTLPLHIYRRKSEDQRERVSDHPLDRLLNVRPNEYMDAATFRETLQAHVLCWGNGYAEIVRAAGRVVALYPLIPARVKVVLNKSERLEYEVKNEGGQATVYPQERIFHVKNLGGDGLVGWSVVRRARESIGLGVATERFGGTFFGNNSIPGGLLKFPARLSEQAAKRLKASWNEIHQGPDKAHKVAVLEEGGDWVKMGTPPEDAQFLETRAFQVNEIARWFGVPPHLLGDLSHATFTNIEAQGLEWLNYGLRYWLAKWEKAVHCQLLTEEEQADLYAEHITEALVKADIQTRYNAYAVGRNNGWLSVNDILRRENMNPVGPEGDVRLAPVNMVPLEAMARPQAGPAPSPDGTPALPAPAAGTPAPDAKAKDAKGAAAQGDVQGTALNGAQITSLLALITAVAEGQLPPESAKAALKGSFPLMGDALINEIIDPLANFEPDVKAPAPSPFGGGPPGPPSPPEGMAAAEGVLLDAAGRMLRKEIKAVLQAAKQPERFLTWMDSWYLRYQGQLTEALAAGVRLLGVDDALAPGDLSVVHCRTSQAALLDVAGTVQSPGLYAAVEQLTAGWQDRPAKMVEHLRGLSNG